MDCLWTVLLAQSHYPILSLQANFAPWLAHTSGSYPRPQQAQHSNYICLSGRDKQLACNDLPPCVATWLTAGSVDIYCCTACDPIMLRHCCYGHYNGYQWSFLFGRLRALWPAPDFYTLVSSATMSGKLAGFAVASISQGCFPVLMGMLASCRMQQK